MKRRKRRNRKHSQKRKLLFFSLITLLLLFSVGYATFSSDLSLSIQGNIKYKNVNYLKKKVTTIGDGLYSDPLTENRYIYRGSNPDNYILINTELFRIVAIETDNTLKVVSDESIGTYKYDDESRYSSDSNDYCHVYGTGCNIWGSKTTMLDSSSNHIDKIIGFDSSYYNLPDNESYINSYLNNTYINRISNTNIITFDYNVGYVSDIDNPVFNTLDNIETLIDCEAMFKWNGFIGLLNVSDIVIASLNEDCSNNTINNEGFINGNCSNDNYLFKNDKIIATVNMVANRVPDTQYSSIRYTNINNANYIFNLMGLNANYNNYHIFPVTHLKSTIKFSGDGTKNNPYNLK